MSAGVKNILISGVPGVGKTTTIQHIVQAIQNANEYRSITNVHGFYTQEIRAHSSNSKYANRVGFDIIPISNGIARTNAGSILARTEAHLPQDIYQDWIQHRYKYRKVSKYIANVPGIDTNVIPLLSFANNSNANHSQQNRVTKQQANKKNTSSSSSPLCEILIVDEIGKMELFSSQFVHSVQNVIANQNYIVIATIPIRSHHKLVKQLRTRTDSKLFVLTPQNRQRMRTQIVDYLFDIIDNTHNQNQNQKQKQNNNRNYEHENEYDNNNHQNTNADDYDDGDYYNNNTGASTDTNTNKNDNLDHNNQYAPSTHSTHAAQLQSQRRQRQARRQRRRSRNQRTMTTNQNTDNNFHDNTTNNHNHNHNHDDYAYYADNNNHNNQQNITNQSKQQNRNRNRNHRTRNRNANRNRATQRW